MEKKFKILMKIMIILICVVLFLFLIEKDRTEFQLKQPEGEGIAKEEVFLLLQAADEATDRDVLNQKYILEGEGDYLYEEYKELLEAFLKEAELTGEEREKWLKNFTYEKKYKDNFYLLKSDWYQFYDAFLNCYEIEEIQKREIDILTGKENLLQESIGEHYLLTAAGKIMEYRSDEFKNCYFSKVTAYVLEKKSSEEVLLTLYEKEQKEFALSNVWIMEVTGEQVQFFYLGFEIVSLLGKEKGNEKLTRETVGDLVFRNGELTEISQKTERINGKLLRLDEMELELESNGTFAITEDVKVYQLYEELRECSLTELRIGYDFADYVIEDGKICAVLIMRKENMESIRVAIKSNSFDSLYHEKLTFCADCDMELIYGTYGERKKELIAEGEEITIGRECQYLQGDRMELVPLVKSGKIQILSLKRNQGIPIYRGKMEIAKTEEGLVLINEVLLEEYLYSVVPSEMPASYPMEALKTQAVCARTYAYQYLISPGLGNLGAHVDDSVNYQVYNNIAENSNSTKAVKETTGILLFYQGEPVSTYYYSTSCGFGADAGVWRAENVEAMPYLIAKHVSENSESQKIQPEDMMQEETVRKYLNDYSELDFEVEEAWYRWEYEIEELDIEKMYERLSKRFATVPDKILTFTGKSSEAAELENPVNYEEKEPERFEKVYDIVCLKRRVGGIMDELLIETDKGTYKIISEYNVRYILNAGGTIKRQDDTVVDAGQLLPSAYMVLDTVKDGKNVIGYRIIGGGYGHGVGMSQNGAKAMANGGMSWEEIVAFFYEGCEWKRMY